MASIISSAAALRLILRWWWLLLLSAALGLGIALYALSSATPTFEARMLLAPQRNFLNSGRTPGSGLSSLLGALQGDAGSDLVRFELLLESDRLASEIHRDSTMLKALFPDRWDAAAGRWRERSGLMPVMLGLIGQRLPDGPTVGEVAAKLDAILKIKTEQQTYRTVSLRHPKPEVARELLGRIVALADQALRRDDQQRVSEMIDYTTQRLRGVTLTEQADAISSILLSLEQQRMLINASRYYTFDLIQPSQVESWPSEPKPLLTIAAGLILPPFLVLFALLMLYSSHRAKVAAPGER